LSLETIHLIELSQGNFFKRLLGLARLSFGSREALLNFPHCAKADNVRCGTTTASWWWGSGYGCAQSTAHPVKKLLFEKMVMIEIEQKPPS
jgi:hypothetical protein